MIYIDGITYLFNRLDIGLTDLFGPLLLTWFNIVPAWVINHIPGKAWDEITYPSPNFNGFPKLQRGNRWTLKFGNG